MTPRYLCGSNEQRAKTPDGCHRWFTMKELKRCWQCGFLFCEFCYSEHTHEKPNQKGGEK